MKKESHGMRYSPEYQSWLSMKQRCTNPNKWDYKHYGGRGITVCDAWLKSFVAFYKDVGSRPSMQHSIDRIDVNGNYEPKNVRWATKQEQIENTRVIRMVTLNGKTQSISAWCREVGLPNGQVQGRESNGWTIEEAILTPSIKGQKLHTNVKRDYSNQPRGYHGRYKAS